MAYQTGDKILDDHYNGFVSQINSVWGVGAADSGYGQSTTLATVAAGTKITAVQWANLLARITSAAAHQGTALTTLSTPTAKTPIVALTALTSNINAVVANRRNAAANGTDITVGGVGQRTTGWKVEVAMTYTITFSSANHARYFFNAGGQIRLNFARTGGTAHPKNADWSALCTACGTIAITNGAGTSTIAGTAYTGTNKIGGSGSVSVLNTSLGFYDLTTTNQVLFQQKSANTMYLYSGSGNRIQIEARGNAAEPSVITVVVRYIDGAPDTSIPSSLDVVDGTLTTTMVLRPPNTTNLTASWGTPTLAVAVAGS